MVTKCIIVNSFENIVSDPLNKDKFEKDIEKIIAEALPYYKSILKHMYFSNEQNANIIQFFVKRV
jgi:adenine-specific DNA methylase